MTQPPPTAEGLAPLPDRLTRLVERTRSCAPRIPVDAVWAVEGDLAVCRDADGQPLAWLDAEAFGALSAELERRSL
jgi:hypothetical protein